MKKFYKIKKLSFAECYGSNTWQNSLCRVFFFALEQSIYAMSSIQHSLILISYRSSSQRIRLPTPPSNLSLRSSWCHPLPSLSCWHHPLPPSPAGGAPAACQAASCEHSQGSPSRGADPPIGTTADGVRASWRHDGRWHSNLSGARRSATLEPPGDTLAGEARPPAAVCEPLGA
jgi:hypothetical protein